MLQIPDSRTWKYYHRYIVGCQWNAGHQQKYYESTRDQLKTGFPMWSGELILKKTEWGTKEKALKL